MDRRILTTGVIPIAHVHDILKKEKRTWRIWRILESFFCENGYSTTPSIGMNDVNVLLCFDSILRINQQLDESWIWIDSNDDDDDADAECLRKKIENQSINQFEWCINIVEYCFFGLQNRPGNNVFIYSPDNGGYDYIQSTNNK